MQTYSKAELADLMRRCITSHGMLIYVRTKGQSAGTNRLKGLLPMETAAVYDGLRWKVNGPTTVRHSHRYPADIDHIAIYPWRGGSSPDGMSRVCLSYPLFKELFMSLLQPHTSPFRAQAPAQVPAAPTAPTPFNLDDHLELCQRNLENAQRLKAEAEEAERKRQEEAERLKAVAELKGHLAQDAQCARVLSLLVQDMLLLVDGLATSPRSEYVQHWDYESLHEWADVYGYELVSIGNGTTATLKKKGI